MSTAGLNEDRNRHAKLLGSNDVPSLKRHSALVNPSLKLWMNTADGYNKAYMIL